MLAQPRVGDPQRVEVGLAAAHGNGEAEADRGVGIGLRDQDDLSALDRRRLGLGRRRRGTFGKSLERALEARHQGVVEPSAQRHHRVVAGVPGSVELLDVIDGDRLQTLHRPLGWVGVAGASVDGVLERRLAELLVGGVAQRVLEEVDGVALDPFEIRIVESRQQIGIGEERVIRLEVVPVGSAAHRGHFLVHADAVRRGQGVEFLEDLLVGVRGGRALGDETADQPCQAFLARRIVLGADLEPHREAQGRVVGDRQEHGGSLLGR